MFDVNLPGEEHIRNQSVYVAGTEAVVASLPWGKVGLSICYDVRFPNMFRNLAQKGSLFISVPSAFTETTGKKHWHTLLNLEL